MHAVSQVAGHVRGHQDHGDVEHRHVDALALAGALALIERGRERERAGHAGAVVDRGRAELDRVHVLGAGHRHDAGRRLDDVVIGGLVAARAVLSERRERGIDQARIDFRQRLVAQPERLERAGAVVLHEHVGGLDQRFEDFAVALLLEVERHRALVGGLGQELGAHQLVVERLVGARAAALVGVVRVLDLDHVGAEHAELIGRERPRQNVGRVDHPDTLERSHGALLCTCPSLAGAENSPAVIPGRREAAGPESRRIGISCCLDSGLAPSARPGMTAC